MKQRTLAFHPFLIAPFPILLLYSRNLHSIPFGETLLPIACCLILTVVATVSLRLIRVDGPGASVIVSAAFLLFFDFGAAVRISGRLGIGFSRQTQEWSTFGVELLALSAVVGLVWKQPKLVRAATGFLNASAFALLVLAIAGIGRQFWAVSTETPPRALPRAVPKLAAPAGRLPDVYFLILDAYGRSDALQQVIGFDNSSFLERLQCRGFAVVPKSTSNYCQTALSLSSTLNLGYLDDLAGSGSDDRLPLKHLIAESVVFRAFKGLGYRLVTFKSGFDATESIPSDLQLGPGGDLPTFPSLVIDQTPLWLLLGLRDEHQPGRMHRERILTEFDDLPASSHPSATPTFTFAHVLAPHPPFLFDADGSDCSDREGTYTLNDRRIEGPEGPAIYAARYRAQVEYVTRRVEEVVDRIIETSEVEPIVIIQGDHGPGSRFDAGLDQPNDLFERMTVLNAIYLPQAYRGSIDPSLSLVNTFRLIFDRCYGAKLDLLPDRNFYSPYPKPYHFTEVTGKIPKSLK